MIPTDTPDGTVSRTAPEFVGERTACGPQLRVEDAQLDCGLRHRVTLDRLEHVRHPPGRQPVAVRNEGRHEESADDLGSGVDVLAAVERRRHRDALTPAFGVRGLDPDEQELAAALRSEGRAEWRHSGSSTRCSSTARSFIAVSFPGCTNRERVKEVPMYPAVSSCSSASRVRSRHCRARAGSLSRNCLDVRRNLREDPERPPPALCWPAERRGRREGRHDSGFRGSASALSRRPAAAETTPGDCRSHWTTTRSVSSPRFSESSMAP
jgi:hypothetical protein